MSDQETARKYADILQDVILEIDPSINFSWKRMFGGAGYFADGRIIAAWFRGDSLSLKLPEQECVALLQIEGAKDVSRHYVEVPQSFLGDVEVMAKWVNKSIEYAKSLSVK